MVNEKELESMRNLKDELEGVAEEAKKQKKIIDGFLEKIIICAEASQVRGLDQEEIYKKLDSLNVDLAIAMDEADDEITAGVYQLKNLFSEYKKSYSCGDGEGKKD